MSKQTAPVRDSFAKRLRNLRKDAGFRSARALAERLEIDENRYTRYERAEVEPNLQLIVQICNVLGTTPNQLLDFGFATFDDTPTGSARYAGGMGEPSHPYVHEQRDTSTRPNAIQPQTALTAAAWNVAERVARLTHTSDAANAASLTFEQLKIASELFEAIKTDPFGEMSRLLARPEVEGASATDREQLAEHLTALAAAAARS